ncbi:hypothetical protein, partial [Accumulibacter sp.]|uniref:hypothetical protein n=1 Tax=Accumulibacter sp. TaxID=2053492 RepID=UPI0025854982
MSTYNGTPDNDPLGGSAGNDTLNGLEGDDTLHGGLGDDSLDGGAGTDFLYGEEGSDTLTGGAGTDYFLNTTSDISTDTITDFAAGIGGDWISIPTWRFSNYTAGANPFGSGHARLTQAGADTLLEFDLDGAGGGSNFHTAAVLSNVLTSSLVAANLANWIPNVGTAGPDLFAGTPGHDEFDGLAGNDTLNGLAGNDSLYGGLDNDSLDGGEGSDWLYGQEGDDTLTGGAGNDYFYVWQQSSDTSTDTITDFVAGMGGDWIQHPTWRFSNYTVGANPFASGHARLTQAGANTLLEFDLDGAVGGGSFQTVVILNNVSKSSLVSWNLGGWNPHLGTSGSDLFTGTTSDDEFDGVAGNDTLNGLAGNDSLYGGLGDDSLDAGDGFDYLYGQEGNDTLTGGPGTDHFYVWETAGDTSTDTITDFAAGAGGDRIASLPTWRFTNYTPGANPFGSGHARLTQSGSDTLLDFDLDGAGGGSFQTALILNQVSRTALASWNLGGWSPHVGTSADDLFSGTAGNDEFDGLAGNDTLGGLAGGDSLYGGLGDDGLDGGDGFDYLYGQEGNDTLTGGAGTDHFYVWDTTGDTSTDTITDFAAGNGGDRIASLPTGRFTNYTSGTNPFGSGHARLTQAGADTLLEFDLDGPGGGGSFQTAVILSNVSKSSLVSTNLVNWIPNVGTPGSEPFAGTPGNDEFDGLAGNDTVSGLAGNDSLYGGLGDDSLDGGEGFDYIHGQEGNDTLTGGAGNDYFYIWESVGDTSTDTITDFTAGNGGDRIALLPTGHFSNYTAGANPFGSGHARLTQSAADTLLEFDLDGAGGSSSFQTAAIFNNVGRSSLTSSNLGGWNPHVGTAGPELLTGTAGNDEFDALAGNDTLVGLAGHDSLYGGLGDDSIDAGEGLDQIHGQEGNDTLTGGAGTDYFHVWETDGDTSTDTITDFAAGSGGDRIASFPTGRFTDYTSGASPFGSGHARLSQSGADTLLEFDLDGAGSGSSFETAVILGNVSKSALTAWNFGNWNPHVGTSGPDVFTGTGASEQFDGLAGNDTLSGGAGNDSLAGGPGDDSLDGGEGIDVLSGQEGNDTLSGGAGNDHYQVWETAGDTSADTITDFAPGPGGDFLALPSGRFANYTPNANPFGSGHARLTQSGADTLLELDVDGPDAAGTHQVAAILSNVVRESLVAANFGNWNPQVIRGTAGPESLAGTAGTDEIHALAGNDTLVGLAGSDTLWGGAGDDVLAGGEGNDELAAGEGNDTLSGGAGRDHFTVWQTAGDSSTDTITDFTVGFAGDQIALPAYGQLSNYLGGNPFASGHARLTQAGPDTLFQVDADGPGGGASFHTVAILNHVVASELAAENFGSGYMEGYCDPFPIVGGPGADLLAGTTRGEEMYGFAGDDTLSGSSGDDELWGEDGDDSLDGGDGDDELWGEQGDDILAGGAGRDLLYGDDGRDTLTGGSGSDDFHVWSGYSGSHATITDFQAGLGGDELSGYLWGISNYVYGSNPFVTGHLRLLQADANTLLQIDSDGAGASAEVFETVATLQNVDRNSLVAANTQGFNPHPTLGTSAAESLPGGAGDDEIHGRDGNDTLSGGAGSDTLYGGADDDSLSGGDANDRLQGDEGNDTLSGGSGADSLHPWTTSGDTSADTITDFAAGASGDRIVLPTWRLSNFTDGNPFASGHARLTQLGGDTLLEIDTDGSAGPASFQTLLLLQAVTRTELVASNFNGYHPEPIVGGPADDDPLDRTADSDWIEGLEGNDSLSGLAGDDQLRGGPGNDSLSGGEGADRLIGGAGNDTLDGGTISDRIGGTDFNSIDYSGSSSGVVIDLGGGAGVGSGTANDGFGGTDTLLHINQVRGSNLADSITGSSALILEQFEGGLGEDTLDGGAITDQLNQRNSNLVSYQSAPYAAWVDLAAGEAALTPTGFQFFLGFDRHTLVNFDQVRGSAYADALLGSDGTLTECFEGLAGNDFIDGRGGVDIAAYDRSPTAVSVDLVSGIAIDGFGGQDTLRHIEGIRGSAHDDTLNGGLATNGSSVGDGLGEYFVGNAGNDTIYGGQGYDRVDYTTSPTAVNVQLNDGADGSASDGFGGTDTLRHIEGVRGSAYNDTLTGSDSAAFESFEGREGDDQIDGRGGTDRVDYERSIAAVSVNLTTGLASDGYRGTDSLHDIEDVRGSRDFGDGLVGNGGNNQLEGLGGNDSLDGGGGNDSLHGGAGDDTLAGGSGSDTAAYADASAGVSVNLGTVGVQQNTLGAGLDTLDGIENLAGSTYADLLRGDGSTNALGGESGNDFLDGGAGNDTLNGGTGNDTLWGGTGADSLIGGDGNDAYYLDHVFDSVTETNANPASGGVDQVYSYLASHILAAHVENGWILAAGAANLTGNGLDNLLYGAAGANVLNGAAGNDTLNGGGGNDTLWGGTGADSLIGGDGNDAYYLDDVGDRVPTRTHRHTHTHNTMAMAAAATSLLDFELLQHELCWPQSDDDASASKSMMAKQQEEAACGVELPSTSGIVQVEEEEGEEEEEEKELPCSWSAMVPMTPPPPPPRSSSHCRKAPVVAEWDNNTATAAAPEANTTSLPPPPTSHSSGSNNPVPYTAIRAIKTAAFHHHAQQPPASPRGRASAAASRERSSSAHAAAASSHAPSPSTPRAPWSSSTRIVSPVRKRGGLEAAAVPTLAAAAVASVPTAVPAPSRAQSASRSRKSTAMSPTLAWSAKIAASPPPPAATTPQPPATPPQQQS